MTTDDSSPQQQGLVSTVHGSEWGQGHPRLVDASGTRLVWSDPTEEQL